MSVDNVSCCIIGEETLPSEFFFRFLWLYLSRSNMVRIVKCVSQSGFSDFFSVCQTRMESDHHSIYFYFKGIFKEIF